ncbi:MAG TPA: S8 family peptidase [Herpetosiphonaceae bacterium]
MKRIAGLLVAGLMLAASVLIGAQAEAQGKVLENQYIVVLKDGANPRSVAAVAGISPAYIYESALNGFAAALNAGQLAALQQHPKVVAIESDQTIATSSQGRIEQSSQPLAATDSTISSAANVSAYVIDTGIYVTHPDFGGRAINVYDALGGTGQDCNGHGTHTASVLGGTTWGVAKDVKLRGVRVFDCSGSGSYSGMIAGVNYVASNAVRPAVANMSFAGAANSSLDTAVTNMVNRGIVTVVAAGDNNANACNYSPARASGVITVGASTTSNTKAAYSNYGSCVEVYAPGTRTAAWPPSGTNTISGTGVAAAYVSGCVAKYLGMNPGATPAQVSNWVISNSRLFGTIRIFTCPI